MTSPVHTAGTPVGAVAVEPLTSLSSTAILGFGSDMTARFDEQIMASMNAMRDALDETEALSTTRQTLQTLAVELTKAAEGDANREVAITEEQLERLRELGVLDELGIDPNYVYPDLEPVNDHPAFRDVGPQPLTISASMVDRVDAQLELRQTQMNSAQEQRLLVLQETMRQRSQLAQLLSNILRESGEAMGHIVRNIT